jgi:hypothetical protein
VVLNSCHSKREAEAIARVIDCAIGYPQRISDPDARAFSPAFYSSIAFSQSVGAAFKQARSTLSMRRCPANELPELVERKGFDASGLVLVRPSRAGALRILALTTVCAAAALIWDPPPDPCAPARETLRSVREAGTRVPAQVDLLDAPGPANSDHPLAGRRNLGKLKNFVGEEIPPPPSRSSERLRRQEMRRR